MSEHQTAGRDATETIVEVDEQDLVREGAAFDGGPSFREANTKGSAEVLEAEVLSQRTAKDPEAFIAAMQGQPWSDGVMQVRLVSIDGSTPTGRQRFTIGVTIVREAGAQAPAEEPERFWVERVRVGFEAGTYRVWDGHRGEPVATMLSKANAEHEVRILTDEALQAKIASDVADLSIVRGRSTLRQGARTIYLLSARAIDTRTNEVVGQAGAWFARNEAAFRRVQWEVEEVTFGVVTGAYATLTDAHEGVVAAARAMAALTLLRIAQTGSSSIVTASDPQSMDGAETPAAEESPVTVTFNEAETALWAAGRMGTADPSEVWDDETGETLAMARQRFATFGPLMDLDEALRFAEATGAEVMSFGYGDDPEGFDGIGVEELAEAIAQAREEGDEDLSALMAEWGPFAPWLGVESLTDVDALEAEHLAGRHDVESDIECMTCRGLFDSTTDEDGEAIPVGPDTSIPSADATVLTLSVDPDYLDEYLRLLAEQATDLRLALARAERPEEVVDQTIRDLSVGATSPALTPASARAFRDLATGLSAATSPHRVA